MYLFDNDLQILILLENTRCNSLDYYKVLFCLDGPEQAAWTLIWSFSRVPGVPIPGIEGELQLNNPRILLSGQLAADGRAEIQAAIPNNPSLSGRTVHLQSVFAYGTPEAIFSNAVSVPIL